MSEQKEMHVERIRSYLDGLEKKGRYSRDSRLTFWRLIISSAHDGYEAELAELDSFNFAVVEDPSLTGAPTV